MQFLYGRESKEKKDSGKWKLGEDRPSPPRKVNTERELLSPVSNFQSIESLSPIFCPVSPVNQPPVPSAYSTGQPTESEGFTESRNHKIFFCQGNLLLNPISETQEHYKQNIMI